MVNSSLTGKPAYITRRNFNSKEIVNLQYRHGVFRFFLPLEWICYSSTYKRQGVGEYKEIKINVNFLKQGNSNTYR